VNVELFPVSYEEDRRVTFHTTLGSEKRKTFEDYSVTSAADTSVYSVDSQKIKLLRISASLAAYFFLVFVALSVFQVIHWAIWIPFLFATAGIALSNAIQLNSLENR
jgi:hypothetical protein